MELTNTNITSNAFGISTNFIYIALGIIVIGGGLYLYKKLKSKK